MAYRDSVNYLYSLQKHGIKLGLENPRRMLSILGNPQGFFRSIHIAGTNGKGSTAAMTEAILRASGLRTGLYTSPHLVSFTERITVGGKEITEQEVISLTEEIRKSLDASITPTFFEFVTAMGFLYFKLKGVRCAIVEAGMGGRLDATNVIVPEVSVITKIGFDHMEFLGGSLGEIAGEKAGIIKDPVPVVSSAQEEQAMEVIKERSKKLYIYGRDFEATVKTSDASGLKMDYIGGKLSIKGLEVPLQGRYQAENASLAIKAAELALDLSPEGFEDAVREGFGKLRWPGRLELVSREPAILVDGAHNPQAAEALSHALRKNYTEKGKKIILIAGIMADKDIGGILRPLLPMASHAIFTRPQYERAAPPEELSSAAKSLGFEGFSVSDKVPSAMALAASISEGSPESVIVITGSFYTIGEAKETLGSRAVLNELREHLHETT